MITRVSLKNWRSHLDTVMDFSSGTNCFVGNIGSGKTTVMDAVCFGLFGTTIQLQQKKVKLEDMIMKKPEQKDQAEVTVDFKIGSDNWSIKRTVMKGKSTAELRKNGELIEGPQPSKGTVEVEKILKMNYDLFSRAVYSEQNQLDMFLTIPKGQRMKKIDELLAIDKFEKARVNTKSIKNRCISALSEKESLMKSLESDNSSRNTDALKMEMTKAKESGESLARQLIDIGGRKDSLSRTLSVMKEQQKKIQTIEEERKKYTALIDVAEADLDKLKTYLAEFAENTLEDLKAESARISGDSDKLEASLVEEKKNLDDLKEVYAEENAKMRVLEDKVPRLEDETKEFALISEKLKKLPSKKVLSELESKKEELEKVQAKIQVALSRIPELEKSIAELETAGGTCPVCSSKLTDVKKSSLLSTNKKLLDELKKTAGTSQKSCYSLKAEISKLDESLRDSHRMEERLEQVKDSGKNLKLMQKELDELSSKMKVFTSQRKMFEKNIEMLEQSLTSIRKRRDDIASVLQKKEDANSKLDRLREYNLMLTQLARERDGMPSFSAAVLEKLELDYQSIMGTEREIQMRIAGQSDLLKEKQKLLEEMESKRKIIDGYKSDMKRLEAVSEQLHMLEGSLELTQEQLRKDFVSSVNYAMQSIWPELYPYKDFTSIRLGIEDSDYVLPLQHVTGWTAADGIVSGGERSIACLALRIALSLVLAPSIDMLVLDEPTANLDSKTVEVLANVLRDNITNFVDQVFLITHDTALENAVSGYLYRMEREKTKNDSTKVTLVSGS